MTGPVTALTGARIYDGSAMRKNAALLLQDGRITGIFAPSDLPPGCAHQALPGGILAPGFVDLQVNGGGGVMFNHAPDLPTLRMIAQAHARLGTTTWLPTLITDTPARTQAAIDSVAEAIAAETLGVAGLHLEGPHLDPARKGAHDPTLIRPMTDTDLTQLLTAARRLPLLKVTLAPEAVTNAQIATLRAAGVLVSLGHTDANFDTCVAAAKAGATCVTHLFNAMRQLGSREPGLVGAALSLGTLSAGIIADLIHVHPQTLRLALAAKREPGALFLVTDAMATTGSEITEFRLNNRTVYRDGARLQLSDGTLAGAHLDMATALRNVVAVSGCTQEQALAMATRIPAEVAGLSAGRLTPGQSANFVHLSDGLELIATYRAGTRL